jgi:hypothetical protein
MKMKIAKKEQARKAKEAAAAAELQAQQELAEVEARRAATEAARAAEAINNAVANAMAANEQLQAEKDAQDLLIIQAQQAADRA